MKKLGVILALLFSTMAYADRTFTFRITGEPETLDWNRAHTTIETFVLMNLMEGLLSFDSSLKVSPSLAESWKISPDGKTYTFKLRPGVKWSDGVPLRAKDFVYSWRRLLSASTGASYAYFLYDIENAEAFSKGKIKDFSQVGVKAPDDQTLQVKLAKAIEHWIYIPTFWVTFPMREDLIEKNGTSWEAPGKMVTLGPFVLSERERESRIVLKSNPGYWGKRGNVDTAIAQIIKDDSTALTLYESGKLDFLTDIAALDLKRLAGRPDLKTFPYLRTGYMGFVVGKYPLSNVHVRRAIAMAIDKSKLGQILHGGQEPASSWVPPRLLGHSNRIGLPFDPKRARAELVSSGIDLSHSMTLEMILPNWDKNLILAQYLQNELSKNLALNIVLQPFDNKTFRAQADLKAYPMFVGNWTGDYPDPDNFLSVYLGSSGNNRTGWENGKFDELVLSARNTHDLKRREKLYVQAQKIFLEDDAVIVPLYYEPNMALVRSRVRGLELNEVNDLLLKKVNLADKVGEKAGPLQMKVTAEQIEAFRRAVGSRDGAPDEAPPTFMTVLRGGEFELFRRFGVPLSSLLHADQTYTYLEPIRAGDELEFETSLTQALTKRGSKGEMHFLTLDTTVSKLGTRVGTCRSVIVVREGSK